jgi:hypothetical protein
MEVKGIELVSKSIDSTTSFITFKIDKKVSKAFSNMLTNPVIQYLNNYAVKKYIIGNFNEKVKFEFIKNEIIFLEEEIAEKYTIEIDVLKNTDTLIFIEIYHYLENNNLIAKGTITALKL